MSIQNLQVQVFGGLTVTQRYPSIVVQQVVMATSGGGGGITGLSNARIYTDGGGFKWLQIADPNTGLFTTIESVAGQAVVGPGVA
jgi:hypothetical protein